MKKIQAPLYQSKTNPQVMKASKISTNNNIRDIQQNKSQLSKNLPKPKIDTNIIQQDISQSQTKSKNDSQQIKKSVLRINLAIEKELQIPKSINDLVAKLKNNSAKLNLNLSTQFDDSALLKFSTQFIKLTSQINYLNWKAYGKFGDLGQSKCIGDIIGKLSNIYRLDLFIKSCHFGDQGVINLLKGISKLNNLHILHLELPYDECSIFSEELTDKTVSTLRQLPNLEILQCEVLEKADFTGFQKISNLQKNLRDYYDFDYDMNIREEDYLKQSVNKIVGYLMQDFQKYEYRIVSVNFHPYIYEQRNQEYLILIQKLYINLILCCFDLPYLIQFQTPINEEIQYKSIIEYQKILLSLTKQKFQQVLITQVFQEHLLAFQQMNPKIILTDLWIN